jgi:hypothetical protein
MYYNYITRICKITNIIYSIKTLLLNKKTVYVTVFIKGILVIRILKVDKPQKAVMYKIKGGNLSFLYFLNLNIINKTFCTYLSSNK